MFRFGKEYIWQQNHLILIYDKENFNGGDACVHLQ